MSKRTPALLAFAATFFLTLTPAIFAQQPTLTPQNSNTTATLIAVSPVDENVVWASGTNSTFAVTTDGGNTWRSGVVPTETGGDIQFRDVQGVSDQVAYLLSIGNFTHDFRIYKTTDGGYTWTEQFRNDLVGAFYDCFAFWTPTNGIAHSDSVNGVFPDLVTTDGMNWMSIANNMPPALPGEASFSSSGTCVATQGTAMPGSPLAAPTLREFWPPRTAAIPGRPTTRRCTAGLPPAVSASPSAIPPTAFSVAAIWCRPTLR